MFWTTVDFPAEEGLYIRETFGAEVGIDDLQNGLRLGISKQSVIFGPRPHESVITKIKFRETDINETIYFKERMINE